MLFIQNGNKEHQSFVFISINTVKRYIRIYEDMGINLERLLQMDKEHLHELFYDEKQNDFRKSLEYKCLEGYFFSDCLKRLKVRGVIRRILYEEYLRECPQSYRYCSFCQYIKR